MRAVDDWGPSHDISPMATNRPHPRPPRQPHHLTPVQRARVRAVWQTMTGHRPIIRVSRSRSQSRSQANVGFVTLSYKNGAQGYNGKKSHRAVELDAPKAVALLVVEHVLMASSPRPTDKLRVRMLGIIRRFIRDGRMTKPDLLNVAQIPNSHGLTEFFAQMV